ncbi:MAG TPA: hypothetical protein VHC47_14860 [Mucilaginibacter sp.]|nr:hypothetical protein [Mucilaginibacter sp.]
MKYAFLFGSNVFIVPGNTISFTNHEQTKIFLKIVTLHHDTPPDQKRAMLTIDADITDTAGNVLRLTGNKPDVPTHFEIMERYDQVLVTRADGTAVLDVHQLDWKTAMSLEHNITAEFEALQPDVVIRLRGDFMAGGLHIEIDNEKLFIDNDSYANSAHAGSGELRFSQEGVLY